MTSLSRHKPENSNQKQQQTLTSQDRIALIITNAVGTMYAVYIFIIVLAGWMVWQTYLAHQPFDPFPFAFLLFLGNIVQLLLMPLIMVGQNLQNRHAEIRADEEYKTTLSSYHDIEAILTRLEKQDQELLRQTKLLEDLAVAQKNTRPGGA